MRKVTIALAALLLAQTSLFSARADSAGDFYAKAKLTFIVGAGAAGGYDFYSRVFMQHMPRHIPGNPSVVVMNMPGAGGMRAADYLANVAAKDGSVIGMPIPSTLIAEALTPAAARYRLATFGWIGTVSTMTDVLGVSADTGLATIEDARKTSVAIGSTGKLSQTYLQPALVNALIGTKFRIVGGYKSMHEIQLAQDRGEVKGHTDPWVSWITQRPDILRSGDVKFLVQFGPKVAELANVPAFSELVKTPEERKLVDFIGLMQFMGRAIAVPPGVPADRVAVLRKAFNETIKDPAFIAGMKEKKLELNPREGAAFQADLERIIPSSQETARTLKAVLKID